MRVPTDVLRPIAAVLVVLVASAAAAAPSPEPVRRVYPTVEQAEARRAARAMQ
jgi:hypothetical protein